jgi:hypothetical protein
MIALFFDMKSEVVLLQVPRNSDWSIFPYLKRNLEEILSLFDE